jgi:hypothetical protein
MKLELNSLKNKNLPVEIRKENITLVINEESVDEEEDEDEEEDDELEEETKEEVVILNKEEQKVDEKVEEHQDKEDEEEELFEIEIDDITYYTNNEENGTIYNLSDPVIDTTYYKNLPLSGSIYNGTAIASLQGDTTTNTNLYNYLLLVLNDYTQNHLNDGLVTLTTKDYTIPLTSYGVRNSLICNPTTGTLGVPSGLTSTNVLGKALTQKQVYSANVLLQNAYATQTNQDLISPGPFLQDVFAVIPLKVSGYSIGQTYVEYGGTLQQQSRDYFGPVNINIIKHKNISFSEVTAAKRKKNIDCDMYPITTQYMLLTMLPSNF